MNIQCKASVLKELIDARIKDCDIVDIKEERELGKPLDVACDYNSYLSQPRIITVTIIFQPENVRVPIVKNSNYIFK